MFKKYLLLVLMTTLFISCGKNGPHNYPNKNTDIVAFGDSLTYGYGAGRSQSYPAYLSDMIGRDIINLGINGDTTATALARIDEIRKYKPYMVLVELSANDFLRKVPKEQTERNLREIVSRIDRMGAIVVLIDTGGGLPMNAYTKMQKQIAEDYNTLFVPGIMNGIFNKSDLKSDEIHPNAEGYKIIAGKVKDVIKDYLK